MDGQGTPDAPLPAALKLYLNTRNWGDPWGQGWMKWPARTFATLQLARNVYLTWSSYVKAESRAQWERENQGAVGLVRQVQRYRREARREEEAGGTPAVHERVALWEQWRETDDG